MFRTAPAEQQDQSLAPWWPDAETGSGSLLGEQQALNAHNTHLLPEPKLHFKLGQELPYFWGHMLCGIGSLGYSFPIHPLLLTVKSQFEKFRERGQF